MNFSNGFFRRATIGGIADYLLYGDNPPREIWDYETRLNEAYLRYEKMTAAYGGDKKSALLEAADDLVSKTGAVYMEMGLQAGAMLLWDLLRHADNLGNTENTGNL